MEQSDIKRAIALKLPLLYQGRLYIAEAAELKIINREWQYSLKLIENYFDKTKANVIRYARLNDVEISEEVI